MTDRRAGVRRLRGAIWWAGLVVLASALALVYARGRPPEPPPAPASFVVTAATMPACDPRDWQRLMAPPVLVHVPPPPSPGTAPPRKTKDVRPVYPEEALAARTKGVVILDTLIDCSGRVLVARVLRGVSGLDQAAVDAVRQWEYAPALRDGKRVPERMTVTVNFTLPPSEDGAAPH